MGLNGAGSRAKGQRGERELFALLSDALGFEVKRKVVNRKDEPDGIDIPGWAVEVKRVEKLGLSLWWAQAERQAELIGQWPILFYRASRQPWTAVVDLSCLNENFEYGQFQVALTLKAAVQLIQTHLRTATYRKMP